MQGYGYEFLSQGTYGPRLLRIIDSTNFSIHDLKFVDSPAFHITLDASVNGEIYNIIIRGANMGGLDGVDVWGQNIHVHDIEVTNKDECVTVKSPASNILVEQIYCEQLQSHVLHTVACLSLPKHRAPINDSFCNTPLAQYYRIHADDRKSQVIGAGKRSIYFERCKH